MRRLFYILILFILLINGCSRSPAQPSPQPEINQFVRPLINTTTLTPQTPSTAPSIITTEPTISITPTVVKTLNFNATSISTTKPTFDASGIQTATHAPAAICPTVNHSLKLLLRPEGSFANLWEGWKNFENTILDYLNRGGSYENMELEYDTGAVHLGDEASTAPTFQKDITNDGIPEIVVIDPFFYDKGQLTGGSAIYVFGCDRGIVKTIFFKFLGIVPNWHTIQFIDVNNDGVPEMILTQIEDSRLQSSMISVYEWNGSTMASTLSIPYFINNDLYYIGGQTDLSQLIIKDFFFVECIAKFDFRALVTS